MGFSIRRALIPFRWAFKVGLIAALSTACLTLFLPNYFKSEVQLLPIESKANGGMGQLAAAAAAFGVGIGSQDSADSNFTEILNSRSLLIQLLHTTYSFHSRSWRFGKNQLQCETLYSYLKSINDDKAVRSMGEVMTVTKDLKSKVMVLTVETESPELSQAVAQRATMLLESFVMQRGQTRGGYKAAFASARLVDAYKELSEAERNFRHFLSENRNYQVTSDPDVKVIGARLEAECKLRQGLVVTLAMNKEQALMEEKNDVPLLNVLDPANLPIEKSRPVRSKMVLLAGFFGFLFAAVWTNRLWLQRRFLDSNQ